MGDAAVGPASGTVPGDSASWHPKLPLQRGCILGALLLALLLQVTPKETLAAPQPWRSGFAAPLGRTFSHPVQPSISPCWDAPAPGPTPGYGHPGKGGVLSRGAIQTCKNWGKEGREGGEWGRGLYQLSDGPEAVGSVSWLLPLALYRVSASCWPWKKGSRGCDHPLYSQELFSKNVSSAGASSPLALLPPPAPALPGGCKPRQPPAQSASHRAVEPVDPAVQGLARWRNPAPLSFTSL